MYQKPLPQPDAGTRPFWEAAKQHRLCIPKCRACDTFHFYPRALCPHCRSAELDWVDVSGRGTVHTFTVARRPAGPAFKEDVPYIVALIDLEEGPRMMSNIVTDDVDAVKIGDPVTVRFEDVSDEISLPKFIPARR